MASADDPFLLKTTPRGVCDGQEADRPVAADFEMQGEEELRPLLPCGGCSSGATASRAPRPQKDAGGEGAPSDGHGCGRTAAFGMVSAAVLACAAGALLAAVFAGTFTESKREGPFLPVRWHAGGNTDGQPGVPGFVQESGGAAERSPANRSSSHGRHPATRGPPKAGHGASVRDADLAADAAAAAQTQTATTGTTSSTSAAPGAAAAAAAPAAPEAAAQPPAATTTTAAPAAAAAATTTSAAPAAAAAATTPPPPTTEAPPAAPEPSSFYVYRAQSEASYPLENVDVADLAGVMWYLHHEVVPATPRKYHIDRIRRYKMTLLTTREFWNVHHATFGPFFAYDGGKCTTPGCGDFYHQYGFVVGCQFLPIKEGYYVAEAPTARYCTPGTDECRPPLWISLPGPCPALGIHQMEILGNSVTLDVNRGKPADCLQRMPGGRCKSGLPTGAPDCTYSIEDAGEILLDELAGIDNYNEFWNASYLRCVGDKARGARAEPCVRNLEYSGELDAGVNNHFWDGKYDKARCAARMEAVKALFQRHYPAQPTTLQTPLCDFDMLYQDEYNWPPNHTGALPSTWWDQRM